MVQIYDLTAKQLANAQIIYDTAKPFGRDAVMGALMTAGDESSWLIYANNGMSARGDVPQSAKRLAATSQQYPHDAVAGEAWTTADSVGLFQQRPMYGYGTVGELMDPVKSTLIFLTGNASHTTRAFLNAPADLTLAQRCQWTQGSEFPTGDNYAPFEDVAAQLIERFGSVDVPTSHAPVSAGLAGITDWIAMADQNALDQQWDKIAQRVFGIVTDPNVMSLQNKALFAQDTGQGSSFAAQFANIISSIQGLRSEVDAVNAKVDALGAALDQK